MDCRFPWSFFFSFHLHPSFSALFLILNFFFFLQKIPGSYQQRNAEGAKTGREGLSLLPSAEGELDHTDFFPKRLCKPVL